MNCESARTTKIDDLTTSVAPNSWWLGAREIGFCLTRGHCHRVPAVLFKKVYPEMHRNSISPATGETGGGPNGELAVIALLDFPCNIRIRFLKRNRFSVKFTYLKYSLRAESLLIAVLCIPGGWTGLQGRAPFQSPSRADLQ